MSRRFDDFKNLILECKFSPKSVSVYILNGKLVYAVSLVSGFLPNPAPYYTISDGACILNELIDILYCSSSESVEKLMEGVLVTLYNAKTRINSYSDTVRDDIEYSLEILYNRFPEMALLMELK